VVWRSLVDSEVTDEPVNEAAKQVVEVTNNTTTTMLEKASENEIAGFQSFTIRNLDNKLPADSDIELYQVLSIKKDRLDN